MKISQRVFQKMADAGGVSNLSLEFRCLLEVLDEVLYEEAHLGTLANQLPASALEGSGYIAAAEVAALEGRVGQHIAAGAVPPRVGVCATCEEPTGHPNAKYCKAHRGGRGNR